MMAALQRRAQLNASPAAMIAGVTGVIVALGIAIVPGWRLESAVLATGLPALLPAAEPPLGLTARIGLMLLAGGSVAMLLWIALTLLAGDRLIRLPMRDGAAATDVGPDSDPIEAVPTVRRGDAHPDAPPRAPVMAARDLGTPFLEVTAPVPERRLPRDLDLPIAAFDPTALPATPVPTATPAPTPPVTAMPGDGERERRERPVDTANAQSPAAGLAGARIARAAPSEPAQSPARMSSPETEVTIQTLLARLERGLAERAQSVAARTTRPAPAPIRRTDSLESTLGQLRKLAITR